MSNFTNHNSKIGAQGDNMTNHGDIVISDSFNLQESTLIDEKITELRSYIKEHSNTALNKNLVNELEKAKKENNKNKFMKYFNFLKDSLGMVSALISIARVIS